MKKIVNIIGALCLMVLMSFSQDIKKDGICSSVHEGTFRYDNDQLDIVIVIKGSEHTEYYDKGKYIIKSKLTWLSECEFQTTVLKMTIPDLPLSPGDVMNVKINKIEGKVISYTTSVNGKSWDGKLIKLK